MPLRVFFSLWPAPDLQRDLHDLATQLQAECGGRILRAETLHLTLAFIAALPDQQLEQLYAIAATLASAAFDWHIDQVGYWRHSHIVWANASQPPAALFTLANMLHAELSAAGIAFDASKSFAPHISLLRDVRCQPQRHVFAPLSWSVREFALVLSEAQGSGMNYRVLRRWVLV